jgi:hypothetical protein
MLRHQPFSGASSTRAFPGLSFSAARSNGASSSAAGSGQVPTRAARSDEALSNRAWAPWLPHLLAVLLLAGLAAYVAWANFWYAYDDAFITYRVAYNFATGHGFVYNLDEWFLGITTPGLGLLLGIAGRLAGAETIPFFGGLVSAVSLGLAGLALYVYGAQHGHASGGLFAGLLLIGNIMIGMTFGGEMPLQMALILWAFVAYAADRRALCGLLLAAAAVVRPDGVQAAMVIGVVDLVRTRRIAWRLWLTFAAVLLPFVALAWIYFGSPLPVTLAAKLAQRDSGVWTTFGRGLRGWLHLFLGANHQAASLEIFSWDPRALGFWIILGVPALLWSRCWWLPLTWVALFVMSYRTLQVPFYHWYAVPAVVGLVILAAAGIEGTLTLIARLATRNRAAHDGGTRMRVAQMLAATAGIVICIAINFTALRELPVSSQRAPMLDLYEEAGRWLHANAAPAATIGYYEIGYIGYYAHNRVVDPLGLLDPAVPPHIATQDFLWAYRHYQPTYILERADNSYGGIRTTDWFPREYQPIHTFTHARAAGVSLTLYQRVAGS